MSEEELFEHALKRISVQAFDALLTCGVRSLDGFLHLTSENMQQAGLSNRIASELSNIQLQFSKYKIKADHQNTDIYQDDIVAQAVLQEQQELNQETGRPLDLKTCTPIPSELLESFPRARKIRCSPRYSEHWSSDPADWSLLSRTLPDLFWVTLLSSTVPSYGENVIIGDLGIPASDMCKLHEVVLLPEDTVDLLFSISLGYLLLVNISDYTFSIILEYLELLSGCQNLSKTFALNAKVSDTPVFADIKTDIIAEFRVPIFLCKNLFESSEDTNKLITWGYIAKISERKIIKQYGFTLHGLKVIKHLWLLKEHALKLITRISTGISADAYSSFGKLTDEFVRSLMKKDYHYTVLMGRLGFLDERKWTLEELGQQLNLTRERIRQIEKIYTPVLEKPKVLERLNLLWYAVEEVLTMGGGVCCVSEIVNLLKDYWKWTTIPSDEALASLISLSTNYEVVWAVPIRIIMPKHRCVTCAVIGPVLTKAVEVQPNGTFPFENATSLMIEFCHGHKCEKSAEIVKFSNGYIHFLDDAIEEILADESNIYTQYAWGVKYGMRRTALVEQIIFNSGKAMHFKEVHIEVNKERTAHAQLSDRSIYGNLERSSALLLWGPGTFIHKDFISLPIPLLSEIENDIISRLNTQNIPYLCITGIFEVYKTKLLAQKVPNANALYSCMRITNNNLLDCPDYPYVLKRNGEGLRLPIPLVLEAYILEQEGAVTLSLIKNYAINNLCVNEAVFMISHLPGIPNLLRISSGNYIHLRHLGISEGQLTPIIDHLRELLEKHDHVAANLLFNERRISCRLLGISTPILLFSIIQMFYSDEFDLSRFPSIRLSDASAENNRASGVSLEVVAYIRNKSLPCSFLELYKYFVDKLGYNQNTVNYIMYQYKNILRYSTGVMVHLESLNWTKEKQSVLETLAMNCLNDRNNSGKTFGLISHIFEYMYDNLPDLPEQIAWTPTLIGELLLSEEKFRIVGTSRDAFVSVPNFFSIETLDDLLYYILNTEYDGAANIDQFISDMREAGILVKSLTPLMLGAESRVVIDGSVVKLARLN